MLTSFAWQHPDRAAELLLAASAGAALRAFGSGKGGLAGASDAAREAYDLRSAPAAAAAKALTSAWISSSAPRRVANGRRILQVGYALSTTGVARLAARHGARLTVFDPDARRLERARHRLGRSSEISFCDNLVDLEDDGFEFIVSSGGLSRLSGQARRSAPVGAQRRSEREPRRDRAGAVAVPESCLWAERRLVRRRWRMPAVG